MAEKNKDQIVSNETDELSDKEIDKYVRAVEKAAKSRLLNRLVGKNSSFDKIRTHCQNWQLNI